MPFGESRPPSFLILVLLLYHSTRTVPLVSTVRTQQDRKTGRDRRGDRRAAGAGASTTYNIRYVRRSSTTVSFSASPRRPTGTHTTR